MITTTTGREFIDALEQFAVLEWYRYPRRQLEIDEPTSAHMVWRFDCSQTSEEQITRINTAIRSTLNSVTKIAWDLKFTGKNWVLAPTELLQLEGSGQFRTDGEVSNYIMQKYPEFFAKAHTDLVEIANTFTLEIQKPAG